MPDGTNNIYVDATFSTTADGQEDVTTELTLADADVIGAYNIPVVYTTAASGPAAQNVNVDYSTIVLSSGIREVDVYYYVNTITSGIYTSLVDYSLGVVISGALDKYVDCFLAGNTGISGVPGTTPGAQNLITNYIVGETFTDGIDLPISFWRWLSISGSEDIPTQYTNTLGINTGIERTVYITLSSLSTLNSGTQTAYMDVEFAGMVNFPLTSEIYSVLESISKNIITDLINIDGSVDFLYSDVLCGVVASGTLNSDLYCCLVDLSRINMDLNAITGNVRDFECDLYSSVYAASSLGCDIDLLSLKISNFQPEIDEYVTAESYISVDITDDVYNVLTSASGITCSGTCCLKVDGVAVPVTFSGITDGYRMFYNPEDDFNSVKGSTEFLVRAENSNGDILERSYYLVSGYLVDYDNVEKFGFDYGFEAQVLVRMSAEDLATCPKFSADAYWFETEGLKERDLGASITGVPPEIVSAQGDITASVYPQSLAYFYGKTFRVVLRCRDFAGNIMEPYEFEFKIEDAPE